MEGTPDCPSIEGSAVAGMVEWESEDVGLGLCSVSEYPGDLPLYLSLSVRLEFVIHEIQICQTLI